jgi:hypothetical protein
VAAVMVTVILVAPRWIVRVAPTIDAQVLQRNLRPQRDDLGVVGRSGPAAVASRVVVVEADEQGEVVDGRERFDRLQSSTCVMSPVTKVLWCCSSGR